MQNSEIVRPITGVFPYLRYAVDHGVVPDLILKGTDLTVGDLLDPQNEIVLSQELLIVRNVIDQFPAPETAWELGRYFYSRAHGVLGGMMEAAPTVGDMLSCWIEYAILLHVYFQINLETSGNKIRLFAENQFNLPDDLTPFLLERDIVAGKTAVDFRLTGTFRKYASCVSLGHGPRTDIPKYKDMFLDNIKFNQTKSYVEIEKATLSVALPDADYHTYELFRQQCQAEYTLRRKHRFFISDSVKFYFQAEKGKISFPAIAAKLKMSERSLRQKLTQEGTRFRQIRSQYIFQQSLNLLSKPELNIDEIAEALGYSETCAFSRAFEKMTGMAPGKYRKKIIKKTP